MFRVNNLFCVGQVPQLNLTFRLLAKKLFIIKVCDVRLSPSSFAARAGSQLDLRGGLLGVKEKDPGRMDLFRY